MCNDTEELNENVVYEEEASYTSIDNAGQFDHDNSEDKEIIDFTSSSKTHIPKSTIFASETEDNNETEASPSKPNISGNQANINIETFTNNKENKI